MKSASEVRGCCLHPSPREIGLTETSRKLPVGEESIIEVDLNEIPTSKREEDVNQEDAVEVPEDQLSDEEIYGATGRVKKFQMKHLMNPIRNR